MTDIKDREIRQKLLVRGLAWCICVAVWTAALLTTYPAKVGKNLIPSSTYFPTAKILHVCAYAFLTAFISWLPLRHGQWLLLAFLSLHAAGTELGQRFVPGRTGLWTDVLIDHAGLLLGLALTWKYWLLRRAVTSPECPRRAQCPSLALRAKRSLS